jgi:hypothetical protein
MYAVFVASVTVATTGHVKLPVSLVLPAVPDLRFYVSVSCQTVICFIVRYVPLIASATFCSLCCVLPLPPNVQHLCLHMLLSICRPMLALIRQHTAKVAGLLSQLPPEVCCTPT